MTVADYEHGKASLDRLIEWWAEAGSADRNEATTRLHLINELLVDVLGWPKCDVIAETSHDGVFADYSLGLPAVRAIVEAKREGTYFELPAGLGAGVAKLETVIDGNPAVAGAARQVLRYCQDWGVPIAVFTNGYQLVDTFVGSGHVNTQKILDIQDETGSYTIPLHEFVRAVIYGDYRYFDPSASPIANVFEISRPDIREHFLLPLILAHVERLGEVGQQEGYVRMRAVMDFGQSLGFAPRQIEFALRHAAARRLLQVSPREATDAGLRYRITTVGAYTYKKLMGTFVYLDAVIVDTPIVDDGVAAEITGCADIEERVARSKTFVGYLNTSWESFACSDHAFDWAHVSSELESDYRRIERTLQRRPS